MTDERSEEHRKAVRRPGPPEFCAGCNHSVGWHLWAARAPRLTPRGWMTVEVGKNVGACAKPECGCTGFIFKLMCPYKVRELVRREYQQSRRLDAIVCRCAECVELEP